MSEIRANTVSNAAGTGPATLTGQYAAKVWVDYNQQTPVIVGSQAVSSVTDNTTGDHTVNFASSFSSATYSFTGAGKYADDNANAGVPQVGAYRASGSVSTSSCRIATPVGGSGSGFDCLNACTTYHGDLA